MRFSLRDMCDSIVIQLTEYLFEHECESRTSNKIITFHGLFYKYFNNLKDCWS